MIAEKKLAPGEIRFVVRPRQTGPRTTLFEVYDRARGTVPVQTPELGKVTQDHPTEGAAQTEADRLNAAHARST